MSERVYFSRVCVFLRAAACLLPPLAFFFCAFCPLTPPFANNTDLLYVPHSGSHGSNADMAAVTTLLKQILDEQVAASAR